jgi:hypothetical protein
MMMDAESVSMLPENSYVVGWTGSTDFPTVAAFQSNPGGGADAFVMKISSPSATPTFQVCLLYDSTRPHKSGSTIPIKLAVCGARGHNLSSPQLQLRAISISPTSNPTLILPINDSGNANKGSVFRFIGKQKGSYISNLDTSALKADTYAMKIQVENSTNILTVHFTLK